MGNEQTNEQTNEIHTDLAKQRQSVLQCGYLEKESMYLKEMRRRWVVLRRDHKLYSYKAELDEKATEIIDLTQCTKVRLCSSAKQEAGFVVEYVVGDETKQRRFAAAAQSDAQEWVKAIQSLTLLPVHGEVIAVNVKTEIMYKKDEFRVHCVYSEQEKLQNLVEPIITALQRKHYPLKFKVWYDEVEYKSLDAPIIRFDRKKLAEQGLKVELLVSYHHKVAKREISCAFMKEKQSKNPSECAVYRAMMKRYEFSEESLSHLEEFTHFESESVEKPECKFKDECSAFVRCERGGNRLDDRCHLTLYRHPPRNRQLKLAQNVHAFILNTDKQQNHKVYEPTDEDRKKKYWKNGDGFLSALIEEVISNGFKYDLCLQCGKDDDCKHSEYSILQIVDAKMKHIRHRAMDCPIKTRDLMLALILYTGCECNYDLCASQRSGDYKKWKWFDFCLYWAIGSLSDREFGRFSVFSGLNGVKLDRKEIECGFFKTYVSTSWRREVATGFIGGDDQKGMLIEFDPNYKDQEWIKCCDVSWISKFPDECEVLFARSEEYIGSGQFKCVVVNDAANGMQSVHLKKK